MEYLASAEVKTTVNNIRAFEDGDKVFLQTVYNFAGAGEQVAFDIFLIDENGKIAENDYNISVSSYVEQPDTREEVDIDELNKRIAEIVARQNVLRTAIDAIVATL